MLPRQLLVPTDLSEGADQALDYACELARALGARVHLLNVVSIPTMGIPELGLSLTSTMIDQLVVDNGAAIEQLAGTRCAGQIGQVLVRAGNPGTEIIEVAKELGVDLIVMATHGRHGISRVLLGSVAEIVVRSAPCAVLTVRMRDSPDIDRYAA